MQLRPDEAGLLSYARALVHWRRSHRFCGVCGAPTEARRAGHVRQCTNPQCRHESFPRTGSGRVIARMLNAFRALP